jgi:hypothetical protein
MPTAGVAGITPTFTNLNFVIPENTTYRMAFVTTNNGPYYGTNGSLLTTAGGVELHAGVNAVTPVYYGYYPVPQNSAARYFYGSITFDAMILGSCFSTPSAGTAASMVSSACPNGNISLYLTGQTEDQGLAIQWEVSPAGQNNWTPIAGATRPAITTYQTTASDYRAVVTCINGGLSATSNVVSVTMDPFYMCYCSLYTNQPLHTTVNNYITNVAIAGTPLSNPTTTWGVWGYTRTDGTISNQTATLQAGIPYTLNVNVGTSSYNVGAWIDYDQSGTMDASEYTQLTTTGTVASGTLNIQFTSLNGQTGMRVRAYTTVAYGAAGACTSIAQGFDTEDYVITIDNQTLSLNLSSISASNKGARNKVEWRTVNEYGGGTFEIERSMDGSAFTKIGTAKAEGEPSSYVYWDEQPLTGINYYRIKMLSKDGAISFSQVVNATVKGNGMFAVDVYPNPVDEVLMVKVYGTTGTNSIVRVIDAAGRLVKTSKVMGGQTSIDMRGLSNGPYLIKYTDDHFSRTVTVNKH